jgi:hypothetical protein
VESEGRQMKQCWILYEQKEEKKSPPPKKKGLGLILNVLILLSLAPAAPAVPWEEISAFPATHQGRTVPSISFFIVGLISAYAFSTYNRYLPSAVDESFDSHASNVFLLSMLTFLFIPLLSS